MEHNYAQPQTNSAKRKVSILLPNAHCTVPVRSVTYPTPGDITEGASGSI